MSLPQQAGPADEAGPQRAAGCCVPSPAPRPGRRGQWDGGCPLHLHQPPLGSIHLDCALFSHPLKTALFRTRLHPSPWSLAPAWLQPRGPEVVVAGCKTPAWACLCINRISISTGNYSSDPLSSANFLTLRLLRGHLCFFPCSTLSVPPALNS